MPLTTITFKTTFLTALKRNIPGCLAICLLLLCSYCTQPDTLSQKEVKQEDFADILYLKGLPDSATDRSVHILSDQGAWFGYALPEAEQTELAGSFVGPFVMNRDNGVWLSPVLSRLRLFHAANGQAISLSQAKIVSNHSYPGKLSQEIEIPSPALRIHASLIFVSDKSALTKIEIKNREPDQAVPVLLEWSGDSFLEEVSFAKAPTGIRIDFSDSDHLGMISVKEPEKYTYTSNSTNYTMTTGHYSIGQSPIEFYLIHSFCFSEEEWQAEASLVQETLSAPGEAFLQNSREWNQKTEAILSRIKPAYDSIAYHRLVMKCLQTLNTNWRSPAGFLQHEGLFPSYNYKGFHGFWAWDSWKHAVGLAYYDTELAQNQIRAMYDFQDQKGMIADCVYRDTLIENHNWRNTKPPLSAWAAWKVFEQSQDTSFLKEILPKIEAYHQWWYAYRDYDQNGLCEYGSTDGTLIAAKWESGMDNAVRFDSAQILHAPSGGHSLDQESVDLNAYLFAEKQFLSKIYAALGNSEKSARYDQEAGKLKIKVQKNFFQPEKGWFFDKNLKRGKPILVYGPEGWVPLWTGLANDEQAAEVRKNMLAPSKFATFIPFPTLSADHPRFNPDNGYWRGPIWLDQVFFAIEGLAQYGYAEDAESLTRQALDRLEGLKDGSAPIWENYQPLTGEGLEAAHFSWSAAHILMLLVE